LISAASNVSAQGPTSSDGGRYVDNAQQVAAKREKSAVLLVTRRDAI
jgi:hypothetical protein